MPLTRVNGVYKTVDLFANGWRYADKKTTPFTIERVGHDVVDDKSRVLGAVVSKGELTVTIYDDEAHDARSYGTIAHRDDAGLWYYGRVQASKNHKSFGASQAGEYFRTEAERDAYVAKRLVDSRKAAEKKAAR